MVDESVSDDVKRAFIMLADSFDIHVSEEEKPLVITDDERTAVSIQVVIR